MATSSTHREIGDYIIEMDYGKCLGRTPKVTVFPGKHKLLKTKVAAKMFVWDKDLPTDMVDREIANMKAIPEHENVLKLLAHETIVVGKFKEIWLILELCPHGELGKFAMNNHLTLAKKVDLMLQSAKGVQHLHHMTKPMIHRDLKPANLLVTGDRKHPLVKVADYGESTYFQGSHEHSLRTMTAAGTPYYQAPELFSDTKSNRPQQNKAVDMFALGVSFQYLLEAEKGVASTPIKVDKEVLGLHMHTNPSTDVRQLLSKPGDSDDVKMVKTLIAEMLAREPNSRPLIDDVVERLRQLRTLLGVKVLVSVDTVWEKPVFYLDSNLMANINTSIESQRSKKTTDPEQSSETTDHKPVTTDPPRRDDAMRMEHAQKVISAAQDVLDELRRIRVGGDTEGGQLMAMKVDGHKRGVYVHEGAEWERVSDVPDECPKYSAIMCRVADGAIVCGGCKLFGPPLSQCHHFSVLTRQWRKLRDMLAPRNYASAVEYDDMKVLVAGGYDSRGNVSAVCEILDCKNDQWSEAGSIPQPLESPLVAADSGRVLMLPRENNLKQPRLLVYDPSSPKGASAWWASSKSYKYKSKLPKDVHSTEGACLVTAAHKLYLLGGEQGLALEYDPLTDQWQNLTPPSLKYYWAYGCCGAVTSRLINVYGGSSAEGKLEPNTVEVYNTQTREWQKSDMRLPIQYKYRSSLVAHYSV